MSPVSTICLAVCTQLNSTNARPHNLQFSTIYVKLVLICGQSIEETQLEACTAAGSYHALAPGTRPPPVQTLADNVSCPLQIVQISDQTRDSILFLLQFLRTSLPAATASRIPEADSQKRIISKTRPHSACSQHLLNVSPWIRQRKNKTSIH